MKKIMLVCSIGISLVFTFSCKHSTSIQQEPKPEVLVHTTQVKKADMESFVLLHGQTVFLKKNSLVAPFSGYLSKVYVQFGDYVKKNEPLFELQTKESKALAANGSLVNNQGIIKVLATSDGTITSLMVNRPGVYITEGEVLCNVAENNEVIVQMYVPFEYHTLITRGTKGQVLLPDGSTIEGQVLKFLPTINETNQTQIALFNLQSKRALPENLNLTIRITHLKHINSMVVSKAAVMTNETQTRFWVMKIADKHTAVEIPVTKGIENDSLVEVQSSNLALNDIIISKGAFGLPDSCTIKIIQ